ncbi:MAG: SdpI family protein [Gemmatimonadetes bacterium]|nr:SdpI family protein [Gemmatimonadota bacterium]
MPSFVKRWYPLALALLATIISAAVLTRLPERMVVHWDMDGNPNGWMPRIVGAFFSPAMMLVMWLVLRAAPSIDPRGDNFQKFYKSYDIVIAATSTLLFAMHLTLLAVGLGHHVSVAVVGPILAGALFVIMGNLLPRARPNFVYGIRTPWTLSSDRVWMRTHRVGGYAMVTAGLVMIAAALLLPSGSGIPVVIGAALIALLGPMIYSYLTWKQEMKK